MKVIIAGSRTIGDRYYSYLLRAIKNSGYDISEVVSGCAIGVDKMGEKYARSIGIDVKLMPADWNSFGKAAGPIRNEKMAEYADAAILLWDGKSRGTLNMLYNMRMKDKGYYLEYIEIKDKTANNHEHF